MNDFDDDDVDTFEKGQCFLNYYVFALVTEHVRITKMIFADSGSI